MTRLAAAMAVPRAQAAGAAAGGAAMTRLAAAVVALVVVLALLANSSLFEVQQTEQALVVQLGQPVRLITEPGLHAKMPLIQTAISFDRRLLDYELPTL